MIELKDKIAEIKQYIHYISIECVNTLTTKQFEILREVETKLNEFLQEKSE